MLKSNRPDPFIPRDKSINQPHYKITATYEQLRILVKIYADLCIDPFKICFWKDIVNPFL
jgi:hypothetical protein